MIKQLLLACAAVHLALAVRVSIRYDTQVLYLNLPGNHEDAASVLFHYTIGHQVYQEWGTLTTEGWKYQAREVDVNGADNVGAYAVIYNSEGHILETTDETKLDLGKNDGHVSRPGRRPRGAVAFRDDFNSFNTANWKYEVSMFGGMNWEFQVYTPEARNTFVKDGFLYLKPTLTTSDPRFDENFLRNGVMDVQKIWGYCTNSANYGCLRAGKNGLLPPIMSSKIMSVATLKYGVIEVRAKIPKGDWLWPVRLSTLCPQSCKVVWHCPDDGKVCQADGTAIWMFPKKSSYGSWPRSGAINLMDSRGNEGDIGIGTVTSTLHWGPDTDNNRYTRTQGQQKSSSWHDDFHTFTLVWTPNIILTFVDNKNMIEVRPEKSFWDLGKFSGQNIWISGEKMAPFDQEFYIIFNVAVGGVNGYFPDNFNYGVKKPWKNNSPRAAADFWNSRNDWLPTWQGDNTAMVIDWVEFREL